MEHKLTAADARRALRDHVVDKALAARDKYRPVDFAAIRAMLSDRTVVRYPTEIRFHASDLQPGEFAHAQPVGADPRDGFVLSVHPAFADRPDVLPLLIAYHLVPINYGEVATHEEAEIFAATLLELDREVYYARLCALADGVWGGAILR